MYPTSAQIRHTEYFTFPSAVSCDWPPLKAQLLSQWGRLTDRELDKTGQDRHRIALLIEQKYGIHYQMVENYLCNFERTMPMAA